MKEKVVLAYSGGLDTTAVIPWLKETFGYDVICCCINCGQGEELDGLEERAKMAGASKLYIEDIIDDSKHILAGRLNLAGIFFRSCRVVGGVQKEAGDSHNGVHGRPYVVRHIGQESTFDLVGSIGGLKGCFDIRPNLLFMGTVGKFKDQQVILPVENVKDRFLEQGGRGSAGRPNLTLHDTGTAVWHLHQIFDGKV